MPLDSWVWDYCDELDDELEELVPVRFDRR